MKGYPKWFTAGLVHFMIILLFMSGALLLPTTLNSRLEWDVAWRLDSGVRISVTAIHVLMGFVIFGLLGALWSIHMRHWWRKNKGRKSGSILVAALLFLGLSGVVILYISDDQILTGASVAHAALGLIVVGLYAWHSILRLQTDRAKNN